MTVFNPFDFFVEAYAEKFPFAYPDDLATELVALSATPEPAGPLLAALSARHRPRAAAHRRFPGRPQRARCSSEIGYVIRMEPGVQTPEETLRSGTGSCRDSGWLLVQILRHLGFAARFVSGY